MEKIILDELDRAALRLLIEDGRRTNRDLARLLGLSESACAARVRALRQAGFISGYTAILGPAADAHMARAMLELSVHDSSSARRTFHDLICASPDVLAAYQTAREGGYIVKIGAADSDGLDDLPNALTEAGVLTEPLRRSRILRSVPLKRRTNSPAEG